MNKPKKSMKIKLSAMSQYKKDNRILSFMEFKMRMYYNKYEGSVYTLTKKERDTINKYIEDILGIKYKNNVSTFDCKMLSSMHEDICNERLCKYNKRSLVSIINVIRNYWLYTDSIRESNQCNE